MNTFMNGLYQDGEGKTVTGFYMGKPFTGVISQVRSTYGNDLNVYIDLVDPLAMQIDDVRNTIVLSGSEMFTGDGVSESIHVYF